jgi:hypothetical protein
MQRLKLQASTGGGTLDTAISGWKHCAMAVGSLVALLIYVLLLEPYSAEKGAEWGPGTPA